MSPSDGALTDRWGELATLARTQGLAAVALTDTQPPSYERASLGPLELALDGLGYSERQRVSFLRAHEVDPIDLADGGYYTTAELRQPFFLDDGLRGMPTTYDGTDVENPRLENMLPAWRKYLATKNDAAIKQLGTAIGRQLEIDIRPQLANTLPSGLTMFSPWNAGEPLPTGAGQQTAMFEPGIGGMAFVPVPADPTSPAGIRSGMMVVAVTRPFPDPKHKPGDIAIVFDFTQTPPEKVPQALDRWFKLPPN
jgi:hypothetical protein